MDGNLDLDGIADIDNIRIDGNTISSQNSNGVITLDPNGTGDVNVEGPLDVNSSLDVSGATTLNGNVDLGDGTGDTISFIGRVDSDLDPATDDQHSLGNASSPQLRWKTLEVVTVNATNLNGAVSGGNASFGNIQIAVTNDNTIDTSSGDLDLNAAGNDVNVNASSFNIDSGTINLGDGTADNIVFNGRIDSHLLPDDDGDFNLGSSSLEWGDLWIDGTANIDSLVADTAAVSDLTNNRVVIAGSGGELESSAILTDNGSTLTVGGDIDAGSNTITAATFSGNASTADGVDTTATSTGTHFMVFADSSSSTTGETMRVHSHYYLTPSSSAGSSELMVRGDIIAFANASSDDKLKTNKIIIPDAIDKVKSLSGFTYEWNELGRKIVNDTDQRQLGVSAQEVQAVLPEAVKSKELEGEEILVVKYEKIVPLLIEAIKELSSKVDNLEQKLSDK